MAPKGTFFERTPKQNRTRIDGLPLEIQQQLIVDAESGLGNCEVNGDFSVPVLLSAKPELYGVVGSKLYKACSDKLRHLRTIKETKPSEYWKIYAAALTSPTKARPSNSRKELEDSSEEDEEEEAARPSPLRTKTTPSRGTPGSSSKGIPRRQSSETRRPTKTKSGIMVEEGEYDFVVYVDSAEVTKNVLLPGLQVFRLLDEIDGDRRLHHTYQLVYTGDPQAALEAGALSASLVSPTEVAVVMPSVSGAFAFHYEEVKARLQRKRKTTTAALKAHTTAVNNYTQNKSLHRFHVLVKFDKTDEELTNKVWTDNSSRFGTIQPKSVLIPTEFIQGGQTIRSTELFVAWNVARVEQTKRYEELKGKPDDDNLVADDLSVEADMDGQLPRIVVPDSVVSQEAADLREQNLQQAEQAAQQQLDTLLRAEQQSRAEHKAQEQELREAEERIRRAEQEAQQIFEQEQRQQLDDQKHEVARMQQEVLARMQHLQQESEAQQQQKLVLEETRKSLEKKQAELLSQQEASLLKNQGQQQPPETLFFETNVTKMSGKKRRVEESVPASAAGQSAAAPPPPSSSSSADATSNVSSSTKNTQEWLDMARQLSQPTSPSQRGKFVSRTGEEGLSEVEEMVEDDEDDYNNGDGDSDEELPG